MWELFSCVHTTSTHGAAQVIFLNWVVACHRWTIFDSTQYFASLENQVIKTLNRLLFLHFLPQYIYNRSRDHFVITFNMRNLRTVHTYPTSTHCTRIFLPSVTMAVFLTLLVSTNFSSPFPNASSTHEFQSANLLIQHVMV